MIRKFNIDYIAKDEKKDFKFSNIESNYSATERYFMYKDKPILPIIGEFHFSRCERDNWEEELQKIKAQGLSGVSVYVFWNHHESKSGVFDFSGDKDINHFLSLCKKCKLSVILRIGPWCHGEARYGGFPDYLRFVLGKRKSTPLYLHFVKRYFRELYKQVAEFCEGETVIGIQLENEYTGKIDHIIKLREIVEEIGFKTSLFTMTMWPTNTPSKLFVPMCGGYPEAPWTQHKRPLKPAGRFAIKYKRSEEEIGADLISEHSKEGDFSHFPYAGCEVGTGNQVTQHRRPIISDIDGYGVAFAKFASGMNLLGYYMYRGGRNPNDRLLQESRITLYPNNYPIIDYDFQAPISKDGEVRKHADRLRLLHLFINCWGESLARSQAFFTDAKELPYTSVRATENSGYVFISNYERGDKFEDTSIKFDITFGGEKLNLPEIKVKKGEIFFFPINVVYGDEEFDYITAQPITQIDINNKSHIYFMKTQETQVEIKPKRKEKFLAKTDTVEIGNTVLHFLDEDKALKLYRVGNKVVIAKGAVYAKGNEFVQEVKEQANNTAVSLEETAPIKCKYNYYLYSKGKRKYYQLKVDTKVLESVKDIQVELNFKGLNLQVFHNGKIVDDYFNTDGVCTFRLKRLIDKLKQDNRLIIKACSSTKTGVGNVYNEIGMIAGEVELSIKNIINIKEEKLS